MGEFRSPKWRQGHQTLNIASTQSFKLAQQSLNTCPSHQMQVIWFPTEEGLPTKERTW